MRNRFTQALAVLLAANGLAWAQMPNTYVPMSRRAPTFTADSKTAPAKTSEVYKTSEVLGPAAGYAAAPATSCANGSCADGSRVWFSSEFLVWWLRPGNLPTIAGAIPGNLATTSPLPDGAINPVFGGEASRLDYNEHPGYRFSLGLWLNANQTIGVDGNYWRLQRQSIGFAGASNGDPILGPTYFDPIDVQQVIVTLASPGERTSTFSARATDRLWGFETNARVRGCAVFCDRVDWLFGFRHVEFSEDLLLVSTSNLIPSGAHFLTIVDSFSVRNRFYGAQIGLNGDKQGERWFLNWSAKLAFGGTNERVNIQGGTLRTVGGVTTPLAGGILAQPTNIGSRSNDEAAVLGELSINVGYRITPRLRTFIGYSFFQLSEVARVGDQIDDVDSRGVPSLAAFDPTVTPTRPRPVENSTYLWAHGINFGVEYRY